ncbi:MAG: hypothetical protein IJT49_03300 [Clostridia bacterium]|nr:hypothetical protein [Clostridia bacterium]
MGLFDKIKETAGKIKESNRNFGSTMSRINNTNNFYGCVNRSIKDGDFFEGSYVSIENGKAVIYGTAQDDYCFTGGDIKDYKFIGDGVDVPVGQDKYRSLRYDLIFNDGKKAQLDIITLKIDAFKAAIGIN